MVGPFDMMFQLIATTILMELLVGLHLMVVEAVEVVGDVGVVGDVEDVGAVGVVEDVVVVEEMEEAVGVEVVEEGVVGEEDVGDVEDSFHTSIHKCQLFKIVVLQSMSNKLFL